MKKIIFTLILFISLFTPIFSVFLYKSTNNLNFIVYADEDEYEEEDEQEEEDEREEEYYYEEIPAEEEILVPAPSVTYVWMYDAGFDVDTDKDGLVDAIDPNPTTDEKLLFTDSDNDTVPDALDKKPNEDDFLFHEDTDENNNGILDSYEQ